MRLLLVLILVGLCTSCDFFASKDAKTSELVNEQLQQINWEDVDAYPLFENCDETVPKIEQRHCFETNLLQHCSNSLKDFDFQLDSGIDPNIRVDFMVNQEGEIAVLNIQKDTALSSAVPEFDQMITDALQDIPPLSPALKRGIPVKAKFWIPIKLNLQN